MVNSLKVEISNVEQDNKEIDRILKNKRIVRNIDRVLYGSLSTVLCLHGIYSAFKGQYTLAMGEEIGAFYFGARVHWANSGYKLSESMLEHCKEMNYSSTELHDKAQRLFPKTWREEKIGSLLDRKLKKLNTK